MDDAHDGARRLLRHALATVAYRGAKTLREAPDSFATFQAGLASRTPVQVLAHVGDLFEWAGSLARGTETWRDSPPLGWDGEVARFFDCLGRFEAFLASDAPLAVSAERLFQGPVADALTHIGQIAMLRRLAGSPIRGENYFKAGIVSGRTGADQAAPRAEF